MKTSATIEYNHSWVIIKTFYSQPSVSRKNAIIRKSDTRCPTIANRYSPKRQDNKARKWMIAIQNQNSYFHKLLSKLFIQEPNCKYVYDNKLIMLNVAGISRLSSVTILQPDQAVLSTNLLFKLTFSSPELPGSFFRIR